MRLRYHRRIRFAWGKAQSKGGFFTPRNDPEQDQVPYNSSPSAARLTTEYRKCCRLEDDSKKEDETAKDTASSTYSPLVSTRRSVNELSERVRSAVNRPKPAPPAGGERAFGQGCQRAPVSGLRPGRLQVRTRPRISTGRYTAGSDGALRYLRYPRARRTDKRVCQKGTVPFWRQPRARAGKARKRGGPCVLPSSFEDKPSPLSQFSADIPPRLTWETDNRTNRLSRGFL